MKKEVNLFAFASAGDRMQRKVKGDLILQSPKQ